jgi:hypothetical protein
MNSPWSVWDWPVRWTLSLSRVRDKAVIHHALGLLRVRQKKTGRGYRLPAFDSGKFYCRGALRICLRHCTTFRWQATAGCANPETGTAKLSSEHRYSLCADINQQRAGKPEASTILQRPITQKGAEALILYSGLLFLFFANLHIGPSQFRLDR